MADDEEQARQLAPLAGKLDEFGRHMDHVIVYPASFGMTEERSRQVAAAPPHSLRSQDFRGLTYDRR